MAGDKCCGNCKHATKAGLSKYYRQWLVQCRIAQHHVMRGERALKRIAVMPDSVSGPTETLMDDTSHVDCPYFERRVTNAK